MGGYIHKLAALALVVGAALSLPLAAQDAAKPFSLVLTIDSDRVYTSSLSAREIATEIEAQRAALAAENRRIEIDLETEEKELTEKRKTLESAEFRGLADAFDEKVRRIRSEQDGKQLELQQLLEEDRRDFVELIGPLLSKIGNERGALVILELRDVLLSADSIDITNEAIARLNENSEQTTPAPKK